MSTCMMIMQKKDAMHVIYLRKGTLCHKVNFIGTARAKRALFSLGSSVQIVSLKLSLFFHENLICTLHNLFVRYNENNSHIGDC